MAWSDRVRWNKMIFVGSERQLLHRVMRAVCGAIGTLAASAMVASTIALAMIGTPAAALAQDFTVDSAASDALTNYLRQNRLPLVGAQIGKAPAGARRLVLYGYVATQQGKSDAESKAVAYMGSAAAGGRQPYRRSAGNREDEEPARMPGVRGVEPVAG